MRLPSLLCPALGALLVGGLLGCPAAREAAPIGSDQTPRPAHPLRATLEERSGGGALRYLGWDQSPAGPVAPGDTVTLTHHFEVLRPLREDHLVFLHGERDDGTRVITADHAPLEGRAASSGWAAGRFYADTHRVRVPGNATGERLTLFVGLFRGDRRMTVVGPPGTSDGQDRVRAGALALRAADGDALPKVVVPRATGPITADGKLDEAAWTRAPVLGLSDSMGRREGAEYPTELRLLWDDTHLYVAFRSVDPDVSCRFSKRDDPIYDHEAVELFLMPKVAAPALGPYVELQASPRGVIFDAAFVARRTGMDKSFDADQIVATAVDGTLDDASDRDRGWTSEWAVPWTGIRGAGAAPKPGEEWRMNAFRIEKHTLDGRPGAEYTAWSPPGIGDFHHVARFGRLVFGE